MPGNPQNPGAQNSAGTKKPVGKPFTKGVSGNPGGRPRSLGNLIREETEDGLEYVEWKLRVARGFEITLKNGDTVKPTLRDMDKAWEDLADRGWGKAVQATEVTGADGEALSFTIIRKVAK